MIPVPIPDEARTTRDYCQPVRMGPPPGVADEDCGTVEMLVEPIARAGQRIPGFRGRAQYAYYRPTAEELEELRRGGFIEFAQYGQVVQPFSATIWPGERSNGDGD